MVYVLSSFLIKVLLLFLLSSPTKWPGVECVENLEDVNVKAIKMALEAHPREGRQIAKFLFQETQFVKGFTLYKWPSGKLAFKRSTLDNHLPRLIFPTGEYFGSVVNGTYTVLRQEKNASVYSISAVYIRRDGPKMSLEWTPFELWAPQKTKLEQDMCQDSQCGFPEMLTGTCFLVRRNCSKEQLSDFKMKKTRHHSLPQKEEESEKVGTLSEQLGTDYNDPTLSRSKRMLNIKYDYYKTTNSTYLQRNSSESRVWSELRVPSSFDLLEMFRSIWDNGTTDLLFKNRIDRRRKRRIHSWRAENFLHSLTCTECHTIGPFYSDLQEDVRYSQFFGAGIRKMMKTGHFQMTTIPRDGDSGNKAPFVGYGNCPYDTRGREKPVSTDLDDVIDFYLRALKIDCRAHEDLVELARKWFTDMKLLEISPDLTVRLNPRSPILTYADLSANEYDSILSGLLFAKFTSVYLGHGMGKTGEGSFPEPTNLTISKEIKFLSRVFLDTLDTVRLHLSHHLVKVTRSLVRLLKNKFIVLLIQQTRLQDESGEFDGDGSGRKRQTSFATEENYDDRQQVMALKEFILFGLRPLLRSATPANLVFQSFFTLNENRIKLLVDVYDSEFTMDNGQ